MNLYEDREIENIRSEIHMLRNELYGEIHILKAKIRDLEVNYNSQKNLVETVKVNFSKPNIPIRSPVLKQEKKEKDLINLNKKILKSPFDFDKI